MDTSTATGTAMTRNKHSIPLLCAVSLSALSFNAISQQAISGSVVNASGAGVPQSVDQGNSSPDTASRQAIVITPRVKLTETWSDNVNVGRSQNQKSSGVITELAPGINIDARTSRLRAYVDYSLLGQYYTQPSGYSRTRNALNAFGRLEAVEDWMFVEFSGVISQQTISAFGTQTPTSSYNNDNSTETATFRVSPYIRGRLFSEIDYLLRYNRSTTQASTARVSDVELSEWAGQIKGGTAFQNLKWSVDATQQTADYSLGRKTDAERLYGTATYTLLPQFRVSASAGRESNNYASQEQESKNTSGYGFDWTPGERTRLSVFKEKRFFGDGHRINFNHRFPLSSVTFSDTKDVTVLPNQFSTVGMGTVFDLFFQICSQQLANDPTLSANPTLLDIEAARCANTLAGLAGASPNMQLTSSFLSSRATVQRRQQLAFAIQGARNVLTVMFNRNESQTIMASNAVADDYLLNNINEIKQTGYSINLGHKLTPESSLNILATRQNSVGSGSTSIKTTTTMYQANLISKLGPKTTGSVGLRRMEFDSSANPYTENALIGSISVVF